jgi:hypothetical protein
VTRFHPQQRQPGGVMAGLTAARRPFPFVTAVICTTVGLGLGLAAGFWIGRAGRPSSAGAGYGRPAFSPAPDDGLLVQTGLMGHVWDVGKDYEVFYPRPYASPPEVIFNTYPEETYDLVEQRKDGFRIRFKVLVVKGERPSYRARGVPGKPAD